MTIYEFRERLGSGVDSAIDDLAHAIIGAAIEVHKELGHGLPERAYRKSLLHELTLRGIPEVRESPVSIFYKAVEVRPGRVDILVAQSLVLEIKVVDVLNEVHQAQA